MKNTLYIFLSLLLFTLKILAQEQLNFKVLNMDDGLSDNTILSITKGPEGFLWFGSSNGLNKYDGKTIKVFKISQHTNNQINKIIPLGSNFLIILSQNNLYLFNKQFENFLNIAYQKEKSGHGIIDFSLDANNQCWAITDDGLFCLDLSQINISEKSDSVFLKSKHSVNPVKFQP